MGRLRAPRRLRRPSASERCRCVIARAFLCAAVVTARRDRRRPPSRLAAVAGTVTARQRKPRRLTWTARTARAARTSCELSDAHGTAPHSVSLRETEQRSTARHNVAWILHVHDREQSIVYTFSADARANMMRARLIRLRWPWVGVQRRGAPLHVRRGLLTQRHRDDEHVEFAGSVAPRGAFACGRQRLALSLACPARDDVTR